MEIDIQKHDTFWVINVMDGTNVVRSWTGENDNDWKFRRCLREARHLIG